jgi:pimeloyl-ACP methyl ester carboxylesterase
VAKVKFLRIIFISLLLISFKKENDPYVEVNGKKTFYRDMGKGEPIIVYVAGLGVPMDDILSLQKEISKTTRFISYDRAGIGNSEEMGNERRIATISDEFEIFLEKMKIKKKFILVGHSRAGFIARYYVNKHPEKVSGIVLIDPSLTKMRGMKRNLRTEEEKIQMDIFYRGAYGDSSALESAIKSENKSFSLHDSTDMIGKDYPNNIPLTILASIKVFDLKYSKEEAVIKKNLFLEAVKPAPQAKLIFTDKSGHYIHDDEPELVLKEILEMVEKVKKSRN